MNKYTILVPHYRTGKMTAYCLWKLIEHSRDHEINIVVIDNSYPDDSIEYLKPFNDFPNIKIIPYPVGRTQSHGVAFSFALGFLSDEDENIITVESDSFPVKDDWLSYYDNLLSEGFDAAGSVLQLSGGQYMHPAGAMYKRSIWKKCAEYCRSIQYISYPGIAMKDEFASHLMVRVDVDQVFRNDPEKFGVKLHHSYVGLSPEAMLLQAEQYKPVACYPFHTIYGNDDESYFTYASRNMDNQRSQIFVNYRKEVIYRIGYEPGQFFCYWMAARGFKLHDIPTTVIWMPKRRNQQQDHTLTIHGFKHLWGVSAYYKAKNADLMDIITYKNKIIDELYETLPAHVKPEGDQPAGEKEL